MAEDTADMARKMAVTNERIDFGALLNATSSPVLYETTNAFSDAISSSDCM